MTNSSDGSQSFGLANATPGQARLLALNHRERAEKVRRPQGRWIVALEETLEAGIGRDDGHRVGWVVRSTPEEGGPGGGEPTVKRLERVAVDDEPGPDRRPDRVEGGDVEIARHRGARVDVRVEEALERFGAAVELAAERADKPSGVE